MKKKKEITHLLPFLVTLIFFILGVVTLSDYGINWDEPTHFMRGQAYLWYFLTGKKDYQGLLRLRIHYPKSENYQLPVGIEHEDDSYFRRSLYQHDNRNGEWFFKNDKPHPPLNDILAAASNYLFYQKLGILGDIEAYHLLEIFCSAAVVLVIGLFTQEAFGHFANLVAMLSLSLSPIFWAESHYNIKDPFETCFFTLAIWSFWKAVKNHSLRWLLAFSIFSGIALGAKLNIIFLPLIIFPWLISKYFKKREILSKKFYLVLFLTPIIMLLILFFSWPYLWQNPITGLKNMYYYYREISLGERFQPPAYFWKGFNFYPILAVIFTTPLVILFLTGVSIVAQKANLLILLWFLVPIFRVSLAKVTIYGGLRQILEYLPAMAILSGIGAKVLVEKVPPKLKKIAMVLIVVLFLPIGFKMVEMHPNEGLYFNPLIGGLRGTAARNFPHWGMSLGNEYRQGIKWLNKQAPPEANLTLARGLLSNIPRIWIRKDINFSDYYYSGEQKKGEYIMEITHQGWQDFIPEKAAYLETLQPIYQLKVEGVIVLAIWKND